MSNIDRLAKETLTATPRAQLLRTFAGSLLHLALPCPTELSHYLTLYLPWQLVNDTQLKVTL